LCLVRRYPYHALFVTCSAEHISRIDPLNIRECPVVNCWESWSPFGIPRNINLRNVSPIDICHVVNEELIFTQNGAGVCEGDRLALVNGRRVRSKEKLIERLAHDKTVTLTVMDPPTEQLFKELDLEVTEDFIANLSIPNHANLFVEEQTTKSPNAQQNKREEVKFEEEFRQHMERTTTVLAQSYNKKIDSIKTQLTTLKREKRQMRSDYEYETGRLKGVNEAILRQNQEMRLKIINQNKRIQEFHKRESQSKIILRELEQSLERASLPANAICPPNPEPERNVSVSPSPSVRVPPALPPRPIQHHLKLNALADPAVLSDIDESELI